jgi:ABC-type multidrug transport system fused ATPase/permease subunit
MGSYLAIIKNTYSSLFCRVLGYDLGYFQDTFTGKIGKSLFRLSGTLEDMMDVMIYSVSRNVVTIVIVSIVFFHEHVLLGTFALIGFMVFLLISYATNKIVLPDLEKS